MAVLVEEHADDRNVGHEEEVDEVDVERATAYILQGGANNGQLGEVLLVAAEVHEDDGEKSELGNGGRQVGPLHAQLVPLQHVEGCPEHEDDDQRIEPLGVHELLRLIPIAVNDVAIEEEGEMDEHTAQRQVVNPLHMVALITLCP